MRLRYTRPALADLAEILDYLVAYSPEGARRVQARIKHTIDLILRHPQIGTLTNDPTIRRLAVASYPYLLFYEVGETIMIIHAIRHGARNPADRPGAS